MAGGDRLREERALGVRPARDRRQIDGRAYGLARAERSRASDIRRARAGPPWIPVAPARATRPAQDGPPPNVDHADARGAGIYGPVRRRGRTAASLRCRGGAGPLADHSRRGSLVQSAAPWRADAG